MGVNAVHIQQTSDGSHTLYVPELNEHYHSTNGAVAESQHVYIDAGLTFATQNKSDISVLEIGFGTGLNAFLTALQTTTNVNYHALELYPLPDNIYNQLNYPTKENKELFEKIHSCNWNTAIEISPNFTLHKTNASVLNYVFSKKYDLVYFDAFAPEKQPEMWDKIVFENIYQAMQIGGILVTYCAKGEFRRTLQDIGFSVEKLPGPLGKRHITRATK